MSEIWTRVKTFYRNDYKVEIYGSSVDPTALEGWKVDSSLSKFDSHFTIAVSIKSAYSELLERNKGINFRIRAYKDPTDYFEYFG